MSQVRKAEAATPITIKKPRCHPPACAKKLKAAPGFSQCPMLNHGVISWEPYKGIHATMAALVATSAASTVTANRYIRKTALSMAMWLDVLRRQIGRASCRERV